MELRSQRLALHPFTPHDWTYLHSLWVDADVRRFLWDDEKISRQMALDVIEHSHKTFESFGFGFWTLRRLEALDAVGFAGLRHYGEDDDVELLYGLAPRFWGRGLATEAALRVLEFAFEECGLESVHAGTDPPNAASLKVIERLGMTFLRRQEIDGVEAVYFELKRQDFRKPPMVSP